jgi:hypothetical protein
MKAKSTRAHLLRSRHALRENGRHRHVVSSMRCVVEFPVETGQESSTRDFQGPRDKAWNDVTPHRPKRSGKQYPWPAKFP